MSGILFSVILVSLFWWLQEQGKLGKIKDQIRKTQSEAFTPTETGMQMLTQAQAEMHERVVQKKKDVDRAPFMPSDPGIIMPQEAMDKRKAEIRDRLAKKHGADPHYIPPKAAADSYHTAMDQCGTDGCYNGQPAQKRPDRNDPHYIPSAARIPSAQDINRMQTAADDCNTPGCDVDKSIGTAPARKTRSYPLGYQLTLAEAILQRGGRGRAAAGLRNLRKPL